VAYTYTPEVLEELSIHGLRPRPDTPPQALRNALRDLYKYEIKVLKARLLRKEFAKDEYAGRVIELRRRYPLLSVPMEYWTER
jgi:ribosomal protein L10